MKETLPRLRMIDPRSSYSLLRFGFLNLVIGAGLYSTSARALNFFIVNDLLNPQVWGAVFFSVGILMFLSLIFNIYPLMKISMLLGLFLKFFWGIALVFRQIETSSTNIWLLVFFISAAVDQFIAIQYIPSRREAKQWTRV